MDIIVFLLLLCVGYLSGSIIERRHFKSIRQREAELQPILTFNEKTPPANLLNNEAYLVSGNVVISIDYFKQISASLRALLGGRITAFETLIDRARREAILRMKAQAKDLGATTIFNVRLETASISKGRQGQIGSVEVYAYGTAFIPR